MSWIEHTPHTHEMRETASPPLSLKTPEEPQTESPEANNMAEESKVTTTVQLREIHVYTYPNRETGHYPDSGLYRDIIKNPTLYMDRADF